MTFRRLSAVLVCALLTWPLAAQVQVPPQQGRDTSGAAGQADAPATALIAGRVTLAGSGQSVFGVRVTISSPDLRNTRSVLTDDDGQFLFAALPAGTYTVRGALTGHISGTYGQKQPGRSGTPLVLAAGQQKKDVSFDIAKGGVISGTIYDDKNRPSIGTPVRVMRWTMQSGERVLTTAGSATTDDRGMYRVYNLSPGDYLVSAVPRNTTQEVVTLNDLQVREQVAAAMAAGGEIKLSMEMPQSQANEAVQGYSPVFFPGTTQLTSARTVKVGVSEEQLGMDFQLARSPLTRVTGQVIVPPGVSPTSVQVRLLNPEGTALGVGQQSARATANGTFTFQNVVPGQYLVFATATIASGTGTSGQNAERIEMLTRELQVLNQGAAPPPPPPPTPATAQRRVWAQADVFVDGSFPPVVTLTLQEGTSLSGSIAFNGAAPLPQGNQRVRVTMSPLGSALSSLGIGSISANADTSGRFTLTGIVPGRYRISASGAQGWQVKSVIVGGIDVLDFPLDVTVGTPMPQVTVQFGDRNTDLKGTLTGADGSPSSDYSVVIFPDDQRYWVPHARRMRSMRPSTDGRFGVTGLPPGDYRIAAVTDLDPAEIMDPEFLRQLASASVSLRLVDGQTTTQDIRVR